MLMVSLTRGNMKSKFSQLIILALLLCLVFTAACISLDPCKKVYKECIKQCGTGQASEMCKTTCPVVEEQCRIKLEEKKAEVKDSAQEKISGLFSKKNESE